MLNRPSSTLWIAALILLCAASPSLHAEAPAAASQPTRPPTFIGQWNSTYGKLKLSPTATGISGSYGIGANTGSIHGKLDDTGRKLTFAYVEATVKGEGWFEISGDGQSFAGKWRPANTTEWQDWDAKLIPLPSTFSGLWNTSFGPMRLTQTGKDVRGSYQSGRGASVTGKIDGPNLKFTYEEAGGAKGEGTFTLSADGQSFNGNWRETTAGKQPDAPADPRAPRVVVVNQGGPWQGTRAVPKEGVVWLIVLEARWERGMDAPEYSYGDMLRTFFARVPWVRMRHRFITDEASIRRWCDDVKYIAEPVVLYFSSHGTKEGLACDGKIIPANVLIDCVKDCDLKLLHFGACEVAGGEVPKKIFEATDNRFPISGFINQADWGGSAVVDFAYLELILARGLSPVAAGEQTRRMISFAREQSAPGDAITGTGLVVIEGKK